MYLVNFPKVRVKSRRNGWVVEIQKRTWYGRKYWTHIIASAGIKDQPWCFSSIDVAIEEAKRLFEWDLLEGNKYLYV